ncbi:MAG: polyphosphate kinase 1 [Betaproteobacteria bacterium]|nr:MAG: polyphosphate kinase 1 [Betaproteobacteria bacterium]
MLIPLISRELSMLAFNERVLAQCEMPWVPALERLRYLTIVSSNLDEFFEVRIAELNGKLDALEAAQSPDAKKLRLELERVAVHAHALIDKKYRLLNAHILPTLAQHGIELIRGETVSTAQKHWIEDTFKREVAPVLTPIGLDPAHPFPTVANKGLHYIVELKSKRGADKHSVAIVKVPRSLPRVMEVPLDRSSAARARKSTVSASRHFVLLSSIIQSELQRLFPGREVVSISQFRLTRDSDLWVDEDEMTDLRQALAGQLKRRPFGKEVRLEINADASEQVLQLLRTHFKLEAHEVYRADGPVNLARLQSLAEAADTPSLRFPPFVPGVSQAPLTTENYASELKRGDVLLHHPYQSFDTVVQFIRAAVNDPKVIAIKQTIYRTGSKSELMDLLLEAVRRGKEVTVVLELKARFDEETNINWADKFEHAGAHVVYGVVGLKTHAKMALILRREGNAIKGYAHVGTGNYNPSTARFYTDFGVLTANIAVTKDVAAIFHHLTSLSQPPVLKHLWWAPHSMRRNIIAAIDKERSNVLSGKPARVMAKVNALTDEGVIASLYEAAQAGVKIDLIVRGACCLAPQLRGWSENITVRSLVGRFLEHSRIYYFENDGNPDVLISSADWMSRNLDRRIEVALPILDPILKQRVVQEGLLDCLQDNSQAWQLEKSGAYRLLRPLQNEVVLSAQSSLAEKWGQVIPKESGE